MNVQFLILFYLYFLIVKYSRSQDDKIYFGKTAEKGCECFVKFIGEYMEIPLDPELSYFRVRAGSLTLFHSERLLGEQERRIDLLLISPECKDSDLFGYEDDFAICKLNTPLTFNKFVRPMPLGGKDEDERSRTAFDVHAGGGNCNVLGWGRNSPDYAKEAGNFSNALYYCEVIPEEHENCKHDFCKSTAEIIVCIDRWHVRKEFCASQKSCNAAPGDNGSPLICKGNVVGILGYGTGLNLLEARMYSPLYHILKKLNYS